MPEEASPDSTGHLFVLLFFFLFSFALQTKLGLFLLFLFAFVFFPLITHIRFSLLEPTFPKWRLLSNVTEPPHRYRTHFQLACKIDACDPGLGTEQRPSLTPIQPMPGAQRRH